MIGTQEIIVIALVILLLFGGKKIPELMRGLGKGVKGFKDEMNAMTDEHVTGSAPVPHSTDDRSSHVTGETGDEASPRK